MTGLSCHRDGETLRPSLRPPPPRPHLQTVLEVLKRERSDASIPLIPGLSQEVVANTFSPRKINGKYTKKKVVDL